jgi:hypothetical protein
MTSDKGIPKETDTLLRQQPHSFKLLFWNIKYKHLIITNILFILMSGYFAAYAVYVWLIFTTTLAATDFIAVLSYIIQKQPRGISRIM